MTSTWSRLSFGFSVVCAVGGATFGCSTSDDTTTAAALGPVTITVSALSCDQAVSTPVVPYVRAGVTYVGALAVATNLNLRPVGDCSGLAQCGHLHVDVTDLSTTLSDGSEGPSAALSLDFGGAGIEIPLFSATDGGPTLSAASMKVNVEVRDDTNAILVDVSARPVPPIPFSITLADPSAWTCP